MREPWKDRGPKDFALAAVSALAALLLGELLGLSAILHRTCRRTFGLQPYWWLFVSAFFLTTPFLALTKKLTRESWLVCLSAGLVAGYIAGQLAFIAAMLGNTEWLRRFQRDVEIMGPAELILPFAIAPLALLAPAFGLLASAAFRLLNEAWSRKRQ